MINIFAIAGPTCIGKTALSLKLAQQLNAEIISVDSALVYRYMDIGSAKPMLEEMGDIKHHLLDIRDPWESYSVSDFMRDATSVINDIHERGKRVLLVGGTMLYFKGLIEGLSCLPAADVDIRQQLQLQLERDGLTSLYQHLQSCDPITANQLHANDQQRIMRALEVTISSGQPYSEMLKHHPNVNGLGSQIKMVSLIPEHRADLHKNIAYRFELMCQHGFLDEVRSLKAMPKMHPDLPSMRSVGYRQAWQYLEGEYDYATFIDKGIVATRQLAKRQLTWIRNWSHSHELIMMPDDQVENRLFSYFSKL